METNKYIIPEYQLDKLQKNVDRIKRLGGEVVFNVGEPYLCAVDVITDKYDAAVGVDLLPDVKPDSAEWLKKDHIKVVDVEVGGHYKINDWEFVATLEHTANGNIIRKVNYSIELPEKYKTALPMCDHCHTLRDRKDTYIIRNTQTSEFKQVGKSCLKQYTNGLDADICGSIANFISMFSDGDLDYVSKESIGPKLTDSNDFKRFAYNYVSSNGYISGGESIRAIIKLWNDGADTNESGWASHEKIKDIDSWVETLNTNNNDYFYNAKMAWLKNGLEYRDFALIASLINSYFKAQQKKKESVSYGGADSVFVGEVGDKITFTIATCRVLYTKEYGYGYNNSSLSFFYRMTGTDGNIYTWMTAKMIATGTSKDDNDNASDYLIGDTIKATIKAHTEYNGEKQNEITRGKCILPIMCDINYDDSRHTKNQADADINEFLNSVDNKG